MSLDDFTDKCFWSLSQRKLEIAVFTNATLLVSEPLTLCCAALVLQHPPNSLLLFRTSLSSPSKSGALRTSPSSVPQNKMLWGVKWLQESTVLIVIVCLHQVTDNIYSLVVFASVRIISCSERCEETSLLQHCSLLFVQKVRFKCFSTTFCTCLLSCLCFNSCT